MLNYLLYYITCFCPPYLVYGIISTTSDSTNTRHINDSSAVAISFVSSELLKCRSLKVLLDNPMNTVNFQTNNL